MYIDTVAGMSLAMANIRLAIKKDKHPFLVKYQQISTTGSSYLSEDIQGIK